MLPLEDRLELDLQKSLILYFDKYGYLSKLLETGLYYLQGIRDARARGAIGLPFCFKPTLDLALISNISGELGSLLCQEPVRAEHLISSVVLCALQNHANGLPGGFGLDHIKTPLRVTGLPEICLLWRTQHRPSGLVLIRGIIVALSTTIKYIRSSVARCSVDTCFGAGYGRRVSGAYTRGRACRYCGVAEREQPAEREEGEECVALVLPQSCGSNFPHNITGQLFHIVFRDDLVGGIILGESYEVVCRTALHPKLPCSALEACSIPRVYQPTVFLKEKHLHTMAVPSAVTKARDALGHIQGALVMLLASHLGRQVLPPNTFMHLRLACLLSLASQHSSRVVPLLVSGGEHCAVAKLLASAASLAPRCVPHSTQGAVAGTVRKGVEDDCVGDKSCWLEAGSLLLASNGVCLLGDWSSLKKEAKSTVLTSIESGKVTLQLPGRTLNLPLRAAVWTHCDRLLLKQIRPLMDCFGLPWLAETIEAEDAALCDWLLDTAVHGKTPELPPNELFIPDKDIRELISMMRKYEVHMSEEASNLLRDYFVASRRARANNGAEECLPIGAIQIMTALAEAHCRLSLRTTVLPSDATAVICLYEQTMVAMFGPALMSPPPTLASIQCHLPLDTQMQEYMDSCSTWLHRYIAALLGENEE